MIENIINVYVLTNGVLSKGTEGALVFVTQYL